MTTVQQFILDRVNLLLEQHNIKANFLLKECKLSASFLTDIKNRNTVPSVEKLAKIANYFHVSVDYLLGQTEDPRPAGDSATLSAENCVIINGKKKKLSAKEAEQLIKLMEAVGITGPNFFD